MERIAVNGFEGLNEAQEPHLIKDSELTYMRDCVLQENSYGSAFAIHKRNGFGLKNEDQIPTTSAINGISEVVLNDTNYLLASSGEKLYQSENGTDAWVEIGTDLLTSGDSIQTIPIIDNKYCMLSDSGAPKMIYYSSGILTDNLELEAPIVTSTKAVVKTATLTTSIKSGSVYRYIVFYSTEDGTLSRPSRPLRAPATTSAEPIPALFDIPVSVDVRVVGRHIYRTQANDDIYFFHSVIADNTTTFFDDYVTDEELDLARYIEFKNMPVNSKYGISHKGRLFFGNIKYYVDGIMGTEIVCPSASAPSGYVGAQVFTATWVATGALASGNYTYLVEYVDQFDNRSSAYTTALVSSTGANGKVSLAYYPHFEKSGSYGITKKNIYRSVRNDTTDYYLIHQMGINEVATAGIYDQITDAVLVTKPQYTNPVRTDTYPDAIAWSEINRPSEFQTGNILRVNPEDGEEITGLVDMSDGILIFKRNSISKLYTTGTPESWRLVTILANVGCSSPKLIKKTPFGIIFPDKGKVYSFDQSAGLQVLSEQISTFTNDSIITWNAMGYAQKYNWLIFSITKSSLEYLLIYSANIKNWYIFTSGSKVKCIEQSKIPNIGNFICGTSAGYVVQYSGSQDWFTGSAVDFTAEVKTKHFSFKDPVIKGRIRDIRIWGDMNGQVIANNVVEGTTETFTAVSDHSYTRVTPTDSTNALMQLFEMFLRGFTKITGFAVNWRPTKRGRI